MKSLFRIVALSLSPALVVVQCQAQISAVSPVEAQDAAKATVGLQIHLIGNAAELPAGTRSADGWAFQVTDDTGAVVANALVTVQLPDAQPSGTFTNGKAIASAFSDEIGRAQFPGIVWGAAPGSVSVRVTASRDGAHAGMLVEQKLISSRSSGAKQAPEPPAQTSIPLIPTSEKTPEKPIPSAASVSIQSASAQPVATQSASAQPGELARPGVSIQQIGKQSAADLTPSVSITTTGASASSGGRHSRTKWIVLAALAGGGAAAALLLLNHSSSSSSSSGGSASGVTIGTPTISISH